MIYERRYKKLDVVGKNGKGDKMGLIQVEPFKLNGMDYFGVFSFQRFSMNPIILYDTIKLEFAHYDKNKAIEFAVGME